MNILIIGDDPDSQGYKTLRQTAKVVFREARIIAIAPYAPMPWASFSRAPNLDVGAMVADELQEPEKDCYLSYHHPCDFVDIAFLQWDQFLTRGSWNLVLTGVGHGNTLGLDIPRRGHTAAAIAASSSYGCASMAFSVPRDRSTPLTRQEEGLITDVLRSYKPGAGECMNVNIPANPEKGYMQPNTAHYSPTRLPPPSTVPRSKDERSDVTQLAKGYVTISRVVMRMNQMLTF